MHLAADSDNSADGFDGRHETRTVQFHPAYLGRKQFEELLLIADRPAAIPGAIRIADPHAFFCEGAAHPPGHDPGGGLGDLRPDGIGQEFFQNVVFRFELPEPCVEFPTRGSNEKCQIFRIFQITGDDVSRCEFCPAG